MIRIKSSPDIDNLYWVTAIKTDKSDNRPHINTLLIDNGLAVRTDGSRLHACELSFKVPDGCYWILSRMKYCIKLVRDEDLSLKDWPKVESAFPQHVNYEIVNFRYESWAYAIKQIIEDEYPLDAEAINPMFIKDVITDRYNNECAHEWHILRYNKHGFRLKPLVLRSICGKKIAAMMPMHKQ